MGTLEKIRMGRPRVERLQESATHCLEKRVQSDHTRSNLHEYNEAVTWSGKRQKLQLCVNLQN